MTRYLLLAFALLAIEPLTDWAVAQSFKQAHNPTGYTQTDRQGMRDLLDKTLERPVRHREVWTGEQQAEALADVWGIRPDEMETAADIFGERKRP